MTKRKKAPWIRIDPERPETLPDDSMKHLLLSMLIEENGKQPHTNVTKAWYNHACWMAVDSSTGYIEPLEDIAAKRKLRVTPYAWQPWPDPAPWPAPYKGEGGE